MSNQKDDFVYTIDDLIIRFCDRYSDDDSIDIELRKDDQVLGRKRVPRQAAMLLIVWLLDVFTQSEFPPVNSLSFVLEKIAKQVEIERQPGDGYRGDFERNI